MSFLAQPAISWSISVSVGMKGSFRGTLYVGGVHVRFCILRKRALVFDAAELFDSSHGGSIRVDVETLGNHMDPDTAGKMREGARAASFADFWDYGGWGFAIMLGAGEQGGLM